MEQVTLTFLRRLKIAHEFRQRRPSQYPAPFTDQQDGKNGKMLVCMPPTKRHQQIIEESRWSPRGLGKRGPGRRRL